jgi:hypothetical protein
MPEFQELLHSMQQPSKTVIQYEYPEHVWVVSDDLGYDGFETNSVFLTEDLAKEFVSRRMATSKWDKFVIHKFPLVCSRESLPK